MKQILFFLALFSGAILIVSCGKDEPTDDTPIIDDGTTGTTYKNVTELANAMGGTGKDSIVWIGQTLYKSVYNASTQTYGEEEDVTDDPNIMFKEHTMWIKYDDYQSPRLEYPVGKLKWIDQLGTTGMNWEFKPGVMDSVFLNVNEPRPPGGLRHEWTHLKVSSTQFEWQREWRSGGTLYLERYIWKKK